jgi:hypothetical protein
MAAAVASASVPAGAVETTSLTDEIRNSNRIFLEKFNSWFARLKNAVGETHAAFRKDVGDYRGGTTRVSNPTTVV